MYDQNNENSYHVTEHQFEYANPSHAQLTSESLTKNGGAKQVSQFTYPLDYNVRSSNDVTTKALALLQQQHVLNIPVEKLTWQKLPALGSERLLASELNSYKILHSIAVVCFPK